MPAGLNIPEMPQELAYIWEYYLDLKNAGEVNYLTIKAYSELMALDMTPSEVSLIMGFEKEYRRAL